MSTHESKEAYESTLIPLTKEREAHKYMFKHLINLHLYLVILLILKMCNSPIFSKMIQNKEMEGGYMVFFQ